MLLVHTDYGRSLLENLAAADPHFDTLFFTKRELLNVSYAMNYYEDATITYGGSTYDLQLRFSFDPWGTKLFDTIEVFGPGYQKVVSLSYMNVPVSAGSLTYLDDKFYLTGARDVVYDAGGSDLVDLNDGDDIYHYASGSDEILGGNGRDIVLIATARGDAASARHGDGFKVTLEDSVLTLRDVERVEFGDGAQLGLDIGPWQNAGAAFRLYQAAFDRMPDAGGLTYWIDSLDNRTGDLSWAATNFIASAEFQDTYGTPGTVSDAAFIDLLYRNVLHRPAEGDGAEYWQGQLSEGMDRSIVLLNFSESAENQANVASSIGDGIWF
jgi:hypothetical protein